MFHVKHGCLKNQNILFYSFIKIFFLDVNCLIKLIVSRGTISKKFYKKNRNYFMRSTFYYLI